MSQVLPETLARQRFLVMGAIRLGSVMIMALGMILWRTDWLGVFPPVIGAVMLGLGLIELFVLPRLLMAAWRRQDAERAR